MWTGQLASAAGVNRQTLRYYERRGLLPAPRRSEGGHRVYPAESLVQLRAIKAAQQLGFTLDEVAELLDRDILRSRAEAKLAEVEQKIADLQVIAANLREAIDAGCADLTVCMSHVDCPWPAKSTHD